MFVLMSCAFVRCCCTTPLACSSEARTVALGEFFAASCNLAEDLLVAFDRFVDERLVPVDAFGFARQIPDLADVVVGEICASPARRVGIAESFVASCFVLASNSHGR